MCIETTCIGLWRLQRPREVHRRPMGPPRGPSRGPLWVVYKIRNYSSVAPLEGNVPRHNQTDDGLCELGMVFGHIWQRAVLRENCMQIREHRFSRLSVLEQFFQKAILRATWYNFWVGLIWSLVSIASNSYDGDFSILVTPSPHNRQIWLSLAMEEVMNLSEFLILLFTLKVEVVNWIALKTIVGSSRWPSG